jgi:hypothetical protein
MSRRSLNVLFYQYSSENTPRVNIASAIKNPEDLQLDAEILFCMTFKNGAKRPSMSFNI